MGKLGLNEEMDSFNIGGSNFKFSGTKMEKLGASEYTLVVVLVDVSSSLDGFGPQLDKMLGTIVEACRDPKNSRADNMMLRVCTFADTVNEVHGFRPIMDINPDDYKGVCQTYGCTAAFDAVYSGAKSCTEYAKKLQDDLQMSGINAALFLITDGQDNRSKATVKMDKDALKEGVKSEVLESMMSVVIGIGDGATDDQTSLSAYLKRFTDEAGFQQYVFAGKLTPATLAKIGGFVSKSASSQSKALGSGGPSQSLSF